MRRIALIRLLLPYVAGTNLGRIAHPQLVTQLAQQIHQPVAVAGGFHADQRRRRYLPVESFRVARGLYQLPLPGLSRLRIQPTHLLPIGMKITSYNHHVRRLLSFREALVLKPRLPDSIKPSLLSNQPFENRGLGQPRCDHSPATLSFAGASTINATPTITNRSTPASRCPRSLTLCNDCTAIMAA